MQKFLYKLFGNRPKKVTIAMESSTLAQGFQIGNCQDTKTLEELVSMICDNDVKVTLGRNKTLVAV